MSKIDGGLRDIFRDNLKTFHWQSIESWITGNGIPDSNFCVRGIEGWVEFKKTDANMIASLDPDQVGWHMRRSRAGGRSFFAVRFRHAGGPRKGPSADTLYIYAGRQAKALILEGLRTQPLAAYSGGPSKWPWERVEKVLTGRLGP